VHVINLETTRKKLEEALEAARAMAAEGKVILFVGTKKQSQDIVRQYAEQCGMPYIVERWIGGLVTNFSELSKVIKKYLLLKEKKEKGELEKYTKKEQLEFEQEIERLGHMVSGVATLERLPDALFITDMRLEKTARTEAERKGMIVFGVCDTNANPKHATYVIPANDDAVNAITMVVSLMAEAIAEGRAEWKEKQAAQAALVVKKEEKKERVVTKETSE
ncbi:MAG: 30S ribosomal protein S2, partial [Patescibacteria group bacterium]